MPIFTEEERRALMREAGIMREAGGWSPKKAAETGVAYASGLPSAGSKGMDYKMVMGEVPGTFKSLMTAVKSEDSKRAKTAMTRLLGDLSFIARVTDGLEMFRAPLAQIAKRHGTKRWY